MYERTKDESYIDYFVRLFTNKKEYELNCDQIAELLNNENGNIFGESTYRKEWSAFERGMIYERNKNFDGVAKRILSISDLHIPFQLPIETYQDYRNKIDILIINGDINDCQAISRFPKLYRISPMEEIIIARQYIIDLIEYLMPKEVYFTYGNHDFRFQKYFAKNIDTDILELMPTTALDLIVLDGFRHYDKRNKIKTWYEPIKNVFTESNIEIYYNGDWKQKIGKTWFIHPEAFSSGTLKTCEKAMSYFLKTDEDGFDTIVLAHTHRTANSKNGYINLYEQGACCDVAKMDYVDGKLSDPQKMGYVYICQDKDGNLVEDKTKLIKLN